jgi:hypothetical protein
MREYNDTLVSLDKKAIIKRSRKTMVVEDAFMKLSTQIDFDDSDAIFLLMFDNPLMILADLWELDMGGSSVCFNDVLYDFLEDEKATKKYSLFIDPDEDEDDFDEDDDDFDEDDDDFDEDGDERDGGFVESVLIMLDAIIAATRGVLRIVAEEHGYSLNDDERQ